MNYDVVVIGAGPAGMAAAVKLAKLGTSVCVVDEQPAPGGQIWRGVERNATSPVFNALGEDYQKGSSATAAFHAAGIDYQPSAQVWQIEDGWKVFLTAEGKSRCITAKAVLLANGAQERPVPFAGWTLPGVMTVGAAQILLKSGGMLPEGDVWIAGAGPLPLLYATQLLELGGKVAGYIDTSQKPSLKALSHLPAAWRDFPGLMKGLRWTWKLRRSGKLIRDIHNLRATGEGQLYQIEWESKGNTHKRGAGVLLVHEGVVPRVHETMALGCDHDWNDQQKYFAPRTNEWGETSRKGIFVAGDAGGIGGWKAAIVSGEIAGLGIARFLNIGIDAEKLRRDAALDDRRKRATALRPLLDALYTPPQTPIADDVVVCRCEEVSAGRIREAARASAPDVGAVKAATRCGMGPCQGRQCGYSVQALVAEVNNLPVEDVRFFNIRPPLKPVTLGEIATLQDVEL